MIACRVGTTKSGKAIIVVRMVVNERDVLDAFVDFSKRDRFDVLLAMEHLLLVARRRKVRDLAWEGSLDFIYAHHKEALGPDDIRTLKADLGLKTAFAARDYGKSLLLVHFQV